MKKKIGLLTIVLLVMATFITTSFTTSSKVHWISINEALALQKTAPRKIIMDVYTSWCGPCRLLDRNTFQNSDVSAYINEHYYAVKFNAEGNETVTLHGKTFKNPEFNPDSRGRNSMHQFSSYLAIEAYPTIVFFDESGALLAPLSGYKTPRQLELFLKLFATDTHKKATTREAFLDYQRTFQYAFRN